MKLFARLGVLMVLFATLFVPAAHASNDRPEVNIVLEKKEIVNKDYFAAGDSVHISGTINGDAYIAGGTVTIDGVINGDLLVAGGTVQLGGPVKNDVRAVGGVITFASTVGGNVSLAAGTVVMNPESKITGSVLAGAGTMNIYAPVGRGVTAGVGTLAINSTIGGDVTAAVGELSMQPKTKIAGDVTYWAEKEAVIRDNVQLSGDLVFHAMPKNEAKQAQMAKGNFKAMAAAFTGVAITAVLVSLATMFVLGLILMALLPSFTERTLTGMKKNPWGSFGLGLVTMVVVPILTMTAMMTVVGIPVAVFFIMALGLLGVIGNIYAALYIGHGIFTWLKADVHKAWQLLVGLILMGILAMIPMLGWLAKGIFGLIGVGAVLFEKQATYKQMRAKHIV